MSSDYGFCELVSISRECFQTFVKPNLSFDAPKSGSMYVTAYNPVAVEDDGDCGDWGWEAERRLDALYEIIDGLPPLQELRMRAWLRR